MNEKQVIPEAAVEAAARGMVRISRWEDVAEASKMQMRIDARAALEAATPHLLSIATIVDQTVELAEIIRGAEGALAKAEAVIAAGYRKVEAEAWDEGWAARSSWPAISTRNPYRTAT